MLHDVSLVYSDVAEANIFRRLPSPVGNAAGNRIIDNRGGEREKVEEEARWNRKGNTRQFAVNYLFPFVIRCTSCTRRDVIQIHRIEEGELKLSRTRVTGGFKTPFKREVSQGADKNFIMEIQRAKFISYFAKKEI